MREKSSYDEMNVIFVSICHNQIQLDCHHYWADVKECLSVMLGETIPSIPNEELVNMFGIKINDFHRWIN